MHSIQNDTARFEKAMDNLRDGDAPFAAETIYSLSDLAGERLETFFAVWSGLPAERRRGLIARLVETAETNFELDFSAIVFPALEDRDEQIRKVAVEGVFEDSPLSVIERLMDIAQNDPFSEIRASAAAALGQFVLRGELGKLPASLNARLQDTMLALHHNLQEDLDVRRRALEAISNCGREGVHEMIRAAYYADDLPMRVSACSRWVAPATRCGQILEVVERPCATGRPRRRRLDCALPSPAWRRWSARTTADSGDGRLGHREIGRKAARSI